MRLIGPGGLSAGFRLNAVTYISRLNINAALAIVGRCVQVCYFYYLLIKTIHEKNMCARAMRHSADVGDEVTFECWLICIAQVDCLNQCLSVYIVHVSVCYEMYCQGELCFFCAFKICLLFILSTHFTFNSYNRLMFF